MFNSSTALAIGLLVCCNPSALCHFHLRAAPLPFAQLPQESDNSVISDLENLGKRTSLGLNKYKTANKINLCLTQHHLL